MIKRNLKLLLPVLVTTLLLVSCKNSSESSTSEEPKGPIYVIEDNWDVKSPDGALSVNVFTTTDGMLIYNVTKDGREVVRDSRLGLQTEQSDLQYLLNFESIKETTKTVSYESISGKKQNYETSYNESVLTFKEFDYYLDLYVRAYCDGFAFRYGIRAASAYAEDVLLWEEEATEFNLPYQASTYAMEYVPSGHKEGYYWYSYEDFFRYRRSDRLGTGSFSMPFLYEAYDSTYVLLMESELIGSGYHGSFLRLNENNALQTVYPDAHGRNPDLTIEVADFKTPWRLGIVGSLGTLIESNLVEDLYDEQTYYKPDNYDALSAEEQKTFDYEWVEPGITAWNWLYYVGTTPQDDFNLQRRYIDLASEMGWPWTIIDGGWQGGNTTQDIRDLTSYAASKGVKVAAWAHIYNDFPSRAQMKTKLRQWKSLGIDGVKVDFFDGQHANTVPAGQMEDKQTLQLYEDFYQVTAEYEMIVNAHGANKPTGERRIYPHVLNREAVRGNEFKSVNTEQTVFNAFIRAPIGPTDFTPTVKPFRDGITVTQQMALNIIYESGTPSMADHESRYREDDYNDFFKKLPAVWDDIHFIEGGIETHAVLARKHLEDWWVAGISANTRQTVTLDFSFLDEENYTATIYQDFDSTTGPESRVAISRKTVTKNSELTVNIAAKGGFVVILTKI